MRPRRGSGPAGGPREWSGPWCSAWWPASAALSTRHPEKQARALALPEQRGGKRGVQGPLGRGGEEGPGERSGGSAKGAASETPGPGDGGAAPSPLY